MSNAKPKSLRTILLTVLAVGMVLVILSPMLKFLLILPAFLIDSEDIDRDIAHYGRHRAELAHAAEFMPALDSLDGTLQLQYGFQETHAAIFRTRTMALTAQYAPEDYPAAKANAVTGLVFLDAPIMRHDGNRTILDDAFTVGNWSFRTVPYAGCKAFGMLGTNDAEHRIAWLFLEDQDRDYIAEADSDVDTEMRRLLDEEFAWLDE